MNRKLLLLGFLLWPATLGAIQHPNHVQGFGAGRAYQFGDVDHVNLFNGNLTVTIPLGISYPVGDGFSYQFTLVNNGNVWDYDMVPDQTTYQEEYLKAVPRKRSNAGLGWELHLGRINPPSGTYNYSGQTIYQAPDGSEHRFGNRLHSGGPSSTTYSYTKDSTYLRYKTSTRVLEFPDGTKKTFDSSGRLTNWSDQFGNGLTITYGANVWEVQDTVGRIHKVSFHPPDLLTEPRVSKLELWKFSTGFSEYNFSYISPTISRGLSDPAGVPATYSNTLTVPLLASVANTDGTSWTMTYHTGTGGQLDSKAGHLTRLVLPTKGVLEWDYTMIAFPRSSESLGGGGPLVNGTSWGTFALSQAVAVANRRVYDRNGTPLLGTWSYVRVQSNAGTSSLRAQMETTVTDPLGFQSQHYSIIYSNQDPGIPAPPGGWTIHEYGLPFTRNTTDGSATPRYLSSKRRTAAGVALRTNYVRYETSGTDFNPRVVSSRANDDSSKYATVDHSSFDGFGHYRTSTTGGNFATGNVRTVTTNYNPGTSTSTDPASLAKWILGTYDFQQTTEAGVTARTEYCFNSTTGFLDAVRTLKTGTTRGSADIVTKFERITTPLGLPGIRERSYGGDTQPIGTGVCGLALPSSPNSHAEHEYQVGVLKSSRDYTSAGAAMPFKSVDNDIDTRTGLVSASRDTAGRQTSFEYDAQGRMTWIKPVSGGDAWTQIRYINASATVLAETEVISRANGATSGIELSRLEYEYDGLGRLFRERRAAPGGEQVRYRGYNGSGLPSYVAEWGDSTKKTTWTYDALGRPTLITPPDGSGHNVSFFYLGDQEVSRTVKVGTAWSGTAVTETTATTKEIYDRLGRLYQVKEPANADGTDSTTTYAYDIGGRLKQVTQTAKNSGGTNTTQTRLFTYDNRGFLTSERHPEKGSTGSDGYVYYDGYDTRGNPGRIVDGPNDLTFTYDASGRVTRIRETGSGFSSCATNWTSGPKCLKEFTYGTSNATGDYRLGKLQVAKRYNYPSLGGTPYTTIVNQTYTYGGKQGRVSSRATSLTFNGSPSENFTQTWTWNDLGDVASAGYPQCAFAACTATQPRTVSSTYTNGWLTGVTGYASSITYHLNGQLDQVTHQNNPASSATWVVDTYTKDPNSMSRPNKIDAKLGTTVVWTSGVYGYDGAGNVVKSGSAYYLYDKASRVKSGLLYLGAGGAGTTASFNHAYDGFGNLQSLTANTVTRNTPTSPVTNRLTGSVAYDTAGNLTSWNGNTYEYDAFNQMKRVVSGTEKWLYMYDADDERVWSFKEGASPRFDRWTLRDLDGKVLRTYEATNWVWSWVEDHVYRGTTLLASVKPGATTHLHTDHLGTVRAATNSAGARTAYHVLYPFGEEATSITQNTQRMKFTGHERDLGVTTSAADDLDYMHARYYNPQVGRFLRVDPAHSGRMKAPQSWNKYSYTAGNPLKYFDPDGRELRIAKGLRPDITNLVIKSAEFRRLFLKLDALPSNRVDVILQATRGAASGSRASADYRIYRPRGEISIRGTISIPVRTLNTRPGEVGHELKHLEEMIDTNKTLTQRFAEGEPGIWQTDYSHWESEEAQLTGDQVQEEYTTYKLQYFTQETSISILFGASGTVYLDGVQVNFEYMRY